MTQDFSGDFEEMMLLISQSDSLAFARFADGEASVLKNKTVGNKDGWLYKKDQNLIFRRDLRISLLNSEKNYFYGLSCTCCDKPNHDFLLSHVRCPKENLTYSNLWVNSNYKLFKDRFLATVRETGKKVILCSGQGARISELAELLPISEFIPVPGNCVRYWERNRDALISFLDYKACSHTDSIFLIAAGPLSEILIHQLWSVNPRNIYLDIGSTLDPILFRRNSRSYHTTGNTFFNRVCHW
jgi:hypothetical protein